MKGTFEADFSEFKDEADAAALKLRAFEDTSTRVNSTLGRLTDSMGRFDSVLTSLGFHISGPLRGLGEIEDAAGKSARELGALSTAGLAVGAALAGWNLGRVVADLTGADDVISRGVSSLLGWGNAAGEIAAAQADVLAKATAIAGREITDLNEAMRINADFTKTAADHLIAYSDNLKRVRDEARRFQEESERIFDQLDRERAAAERKRAEDNKRGMEDFERGLLREFDLEMGVWQTGIKLTDELNARMQKKLELQTAFVTQLTLERSKAVESNAARSLGPGVSDPALDAAVKRDAALAQIEANRARAPAFDFGPLVEKVWRDFDEQILKRGGALTPAPPVTVNVSGVWDPATVRQITDAVNDENMRRSGRLWPGR